MLLAYQNSIPTHSSKCISIVKWCVTACLYLSSCAQNAEIQITEGHCTEVPEGNEKRVLETRVSTAASQSLAGFVCVLGLQSGQNLRAIDEDLWQKECLSCEGLEVPRGCLRPQTVRKENRHDLNVEFIIKREAEREDLETPQPGHVKNKSLFGRDCKGCGPATVCSRD